MQISEEFYIYKLRDELSRKQAVNPKYSLRAFAKEIGIDSSNLSGILRYKRKLPAKKADSVATRLKLAPREKALFVSSAYRHRSLLDQISIKQQVKHYMLDEVYFKVIAQWDYYALLKLMTLKCFQSDPIWISEKLQISKHRVEVILKELQELGFIKVNNKGKLSRQIPSLDTSEDVQSLALQTSHQENLELAKEKLKQVEVNKRDFSSMTVGVNTKKMKEAKSIIREFSAKLKSLVEDDQAEEVYIFSCQFFPVTKEDEEKS